MITYGIHEHKGHVYLVWQDMEDLVNESQQKITNAVTVNIKEFTEPKHVERKTLEALNGYCECNYKSKI